MDVLEKAKITIRKYSMLSGGERVLIGLSGGADSVSLLHVLAGLRGELGLSLEALYIDHGMRPEETPKEMEFARSLAASFDIPFHSDKIDVISHAKKTGFGKQEAARELRYQCYELYRASLGANRIALGHTAEDQLETFLMRLIRGTGPKGLASIPAVRRYIIRPLIEVRRAEIEDYLREKGAGYVTDSSNLRRDYTRNKIRHSLVPILKGFNPRIVEAVSRMAGILADEERYFDTIVLKTIMKLITRKNDMEIELFLVPLESMDRVILRRVLRHAVSVVRGLRGLDLGHIEDVIGLVKGGSPGQRIYLPGRMRAVKKYSTLLITAKSPAKVGEYRLEVPGSVRIGETGAVLTASVSNLADAGADKKTAILDADKIAPPLTVRSRKKGDYFHPIGFSGKRKKLQDFFVDEKIPRDERDSVPLVLSSDDIIWVAGMRADERFRATEKTERFLALEIKE